MSDEERKAVEATRERRKQVGAQKTQSSGGGGGASSQASWTDRTVPELQDELRSRDLPTSGTKDELVSRLEDSDAGR